MKTAAVAALAGLAAATPQAPGWYDGNEFTHVGRSPSKATVTFTAAMPMQGVETLEKKLLEISDPAHPSYGQWLKQADVAKLTAVKASDKKAVRQFLAQNGAKCVEMPHSFTCKASVASVERMLSTKLSAFQQAGTNKVHHRLHPTQGWTFPEALKGKVSFLSGIGDFPSAKRRHGKLHGYGKDGKPAMTVEAAGSSDDDHPQPPQDAMVITMETLQNLYKVPTNPPVGKGFTGGPAEFQDDASWAVSDEQLFVQQSGVPVLFNATTVVGPFDPSSPDAEASLDWQYYGGVAYNTDLFYLTQALWMYEFTQQLAAMPDSVLPSIFSMSWGWWEGDQCSIDSSNGPCASGGTSAAYVNATNSGFAAAAARGVSFLVSSGDSGAHGRTDPNCGSAHTRAAYPASSPWVTAVGATQLVNATAIASPKTPICQSKASGTCAQSGTEIVCSTATGALIVSGGGFSDIAPAQSWQTAAIAGYLKSGAKTPGAGNFSPNGRGTPDVSVVGHNYLIWLSGSVTPVDGTSCSAPVFAGIIANMNALRVKAGKPVLGYLNPLIYGTLAPKGAFNDITLGDNSCTEDSGAPCPQCTGFGAAKGWDAASGFGTPKYDVFQSIIQSLP